MRSADENNEGDLTIDELVRLAFDPDPEDDYVKNYRPTEGTLDR